MQGKLHANDVKLVLRTKCRSLAPCVGFGIPPDKVRSGISVEAVRAKIGADEPHRSGRSTASINTSAAISTGSSILADPSNEFLQIISRLTASGSRVTWHSFSRTTGLSTNSTYNLKSIVLHFCSIDFYVLLYRTTYAYVRLSTFVFLPGQRWPSSPLPSSAQ